MRFKILVVPSLLLLAATGIFAGEPMANADQAETAQRVINQTPGFNDTATGPTKPDGPVQSPGWA